MSGGNKEIVEAVNAAFAAGNIEGFLSYCAEDVEWIVAGEDPVKGKDAIRKWMAAMDGEPPQFEVDDVIAEGDAVAAYGAMTMKDDEEEAVRYAYCDIYRFRNGKIVELRSFVVMNDDNP